MRAIRIYGKKDVTTITPLSTLPLPQYQCNSLRLKLSVILSQQNILYSTLGLESIHQSTFNVRHIVKNVHFLVIQILGVRDQKH